MIHVYVNLILKGLKSIDDVPKQIRNEVQTALNELDV